MPKQQFLTCLNNRLERVKHGNSYYWYGLYLCTNCGNKVSVINSNVKLNKQVSCGCYHSALVTTMKTTHGKAKTALYAVWNTMLARCNNPKSQKYKVYGARGIKVCKEWLTFEGFFATMGERPFKGAQLDRIDVDGNYEPSNVRWATAKENANNQQRHKLRSTKL